MSWLARLSLRNRALIALSTVVIALFGVYSASSLKLELIPSLEVPVVVAVTPYPGSSPEVVDAQISEPIEKAALSIDGANSTSSSSTNGSSFVLVNLEYGTDVDQATRDFESALNSATVQLPSDVEPMVIAGDISDFPIIQLSVSAEGGLDELATRVEERVVPVLSELDGVREVTLTGAPDTQVSLDLDQAKIAAAGLSADSIRTALTNNGVLVPAGTVTDDDRQLSVQVGAPLDTIEDLESLPLVGGSEEVTLGDVASIEFATAEATSIARTDGNASVSVGITKTQSGNTVDVSHAVQEKFDELEAAVGEEASIDVVFDQAPFIEQSVEDLTTEGLLGLVMAVIVILVFLLSLRSTLVTAISIPLSILVTFIALFVGGYSLNILTLGAITVAIGRVVDDSIVVIENIKRHLSYGEEKRRAVLTGVREVAGAITSSTVATMAVFLPIAVVGGQVGELFQPFAVTVSVALAASLLVSLTIVPVLAYWFLKPTVGEVDPELVRREAHEKERAGFLQRTYLPVLRASTKHPVITIVLAIAIFGGTLAMTPFLKTNFLGDTGQNTLTVTQVLEPGASLSRQDEAATEVEEALMGIDGVETVQATIGSGDGIAALIGSGADASFSLTTDPDADQEAIQSEIRAALGELEGVGETAIDASGGFGSSVEVVVSADDPEDLDAAATTVLQAVEAVDGAEDVSSNASGAEPTITVEVDRAKAAAAGLDEVGVAGILSGALRAQNLGSVEIDGTQRDIVIANGEGPGSVKELAATPVPTSSGVVPLSRIAKVEEVELPTSVTRLDGERSVTITTTPGSDNLGAVTTDIQSAIDELELPEGVEASLGGVAADQDEAFAQLGLALIIAIAIVYIIMVATFRSLMQPLILLVSIPFAATGALGLLLITGVPLGVASLIGMLMLIGIVVTNAIVLIDLVNQYREQGVSATEAVTEGARQRLRPILMTALATIMALTPMALGLTGGSAFISQPLAVVVIGGLVSSTLLTLILVPVLYLLVERARGRVGRKAVVAQ